MDDFLKLILFPLHAMAQIWAESADDKLWQKYFWWYIVLIIFLVVLMIYLIINT